MNVNDPKQMVSSLIQFAAAYQYTKHLPKYLKPWWDWLFIFYCDLLYNKNDLLKWERFFTERLHPRIYVRSPLTTHMHEVWVKTQEITKTLRSGTLYEIIDNLGLF